MEDGEVKAIIAGVARELSSIGWVVGGCGPHAFRSRANQKRTATLLMYVLWQISV